MNIYESREDVFDKLENFIKSNLKDPDSYNNDLQIEDEVIKFSVKNKRYKINCDLSYKLICRKILDFINYYNL